MSNKDKNSNREKELERLRHDMAKDKADQPRFSKWIKLMESKKNLFAIEDEIDKLINDLKDKKASR